MEVKVKCNNCGRIHTIEYGEFINGNFRCYCGCCSAEIIKDESKDAGGYF